MYIGLLAIALLFSGVAGWYLGKDSSSIQNNTPVRTEDFSPTERNSRRQQNQLKLAAVRRQIAQIVDREVTPIEDEDALERYLDALAKRAEEKGMVTALEVQPGIEAIRRRYAGENPEEMAEKVDAFSQEMALLSKSLRHEVDQLPPADLDQLYDDIEQEADKGERERLIAKYIEQTQSMEPETQMKAISRLDEMVAARREPPQDVDFESLLGEINTAEDNGMRQKLIRRFLKKVHTLEPDIQAAWLDRLNRTIR